MSYGLMGWAVDIDELKSLFSPQGAARLQAIENEIQDELSRLDEEFAEEIKEGCPTAREALARLANGPLTDSSCGFMYAYVVKEVVNRVGYFLDNSSVYSLHTSDLRALDETLTGLGVKGISLSALAFGTLPIRIPTPDGFPGCSHLTPERIRASLAELEANPYAGPDEDKRRVIEGITGWMREAADRQLGIVSFYH